MNLRFLPSGPALLVEETEKVLVIADLHFGIEADLARHGIHFPSGSVERTKRVLACIRETAPDLLILLGDIKHNVPVTTRQEFRELPTFLDALRERVTVRVIPGNHDGGIERFLSPEELLDPAGVVIDGTGYFHGHTRPSPVLAGHLILAGHHHPLVTLTDTVGCALRAPGYIFSPLKEECLGLPGHGEGEESRVLILPAFNEIAGYDIRRIIAEPTSPLARCLDTERAEVILADGTWLGPLPVVMDDACD